MMMYVDPLLCSNEIINTIIINNVGLMLLRINPGVPFTA